MVTVGPLSGLLGNARGLFQFSETRRAASMRQKSIAARKVAGLQEEAGIQSMQGMIKGLPCPV